MKRYYIFSCGSLNDNYQYQLETIVETLEGAEFFLQENRNIPKIMVLEVMGEYRPTKLVKQEE